MSNLRHPSQDQAGSQARSHRRPIPRARPPPDPLDLQVSSTIMQLQPFSIHNFPNAKNECEHRPSASKEIEAVRDWD